MGVAEDIRGIAASVPKRKRYVRTEEATKNAFVMPFISALGYDIHDPLEVIPEFTADAGVRQQEKVDYAIMKDGRPSILVECKSANVSLGKDHLSQLIRYYAVTDARYGILTNGVVYQFFTDLVKRNVMDEEPFLVVDMLDLSDDMLAEVARFARSEFDAQAIWDLVDRRQTEERELKIIGENIAREFANPSRDLVRILAKGVLRKGNQRRSEWERVTSLTKGALEQCAGTGVAAESLGEINHSPAKTREEARKERQREAGRKAAQTRRRNQAVQRGEKPEFGIFENWEAVVANSLVYALFNSLCDYVCSLGDDVKVNPTKYYISFMKGRTFSYVFPQPRSNRLKVYVNAEPGHAHFLQKRLSKLPEDHAYPPCNAQQFIDNEDELEEAKQHLLRSYDEAG